VKKIAPGVLLGDYELVRELGRGGIGTVWEATQVSLGRKVALKILAPHIAVSETSLQRFQREAEAGGRLTHPNIVAVYQIDEEEGVHFIAQELVEGGHTLADRIRNSRDEATLDKDYYHSIALIFAQIAEALQHAHDDGTIHRDIKPSNILLNKEDQPKVADFGLAQVEDALDLSRTGEFAGTPFYMSPEQAMSKRIGIDHRTDIFSLGVSLWEALALQRPFEGDTSQQILQKIITETPADPRRIRSRCPGPLAIICLKAMEKQVGRRFQSMSEFAADLRRFLADEPILSKLPTFIYRSWQWVKKNYMASACIAAIVLGLFTSLFLWQRAKKSELIAISAVGALGNMIEALAPTAASSSPERTKELLNEAEKNIRDKVASPMLRANVVTSLAKAISKAGDYRRALSLLDESLLVYKEKNMLESNMAIALQGLRADTLMKLSDFDKAKETYLTLLDIKKKVYGEDSVPYFSTLNGLGTIEAQTGNSEAAKEYLEAAYEGLERHLGISDELTLLPLNNLGNVYRSLGRDEEAYQVMRKVVEERTKLLGKDHPDTLTALSNWSAHSASMLDRKVNQYQGADAVRRAPENFENVIATFDDVIEAQTGALGADHPDTLLTSYNLVMLYYRYSRIKEAEELAQEILPLMRGSLGDNHQVTLGTLSILGALSDQLDKKPLAGSLHKEAVDGAIDKLGVMHPMTNDIVYRYVMHLRAIREYKIALEHANLILPGHIKLFGEDHPYTLELKEQLKFLDTKGLLIEAWKLVNPDRKNRKTDTAEGLAIIEAVLKTHELEYLCHHGGDCPLDTLAWAHFANENYDEAIIASERAIAVAPEERKPLLQGNLERLKKMIAAAGEF
jgi:serine/threonine protein kinase